MRFHIFLISTLYKQIEVIYINEIRRCVPRSENVRTHKICVYKCMWIINSVLNMKSDTIYFMVASKIIQGSMIS